MNLIDKYLCEDKYKRMNNKLNKIINKYSSIKKYNYDSKNGFEIILKDEEEANKLAKDIEKNFKTKIKVKQVLKDMWELTGK